MEITVQALKMMEVGKSFIMATASKEGKPHCAPKSLLKKDGITAYFVDYSVGRSVENLRANPQASISFIDKKSLFGYRVSGNVEIIEKGSIYEECYRLLEEKEIELSVERIIKGVKEGKAHKHFELNISTKFLVYKIKMEEGCEISPSGTIKREKI